jgi:hypothetical protein
VVAEEGSDAAAFVTIFYGDVECSTTAPAGRVADGPAASQAKSGRRVVATEARATVRAVRADLT